MSYPIPELESGAQNRAAIATALGLMAMLVEELVRSGAVDAGRLEEQMDQFVLSASVTIGTAPGEAQYVERLVKLVKKGLASASKEGGDE